MVDAFTRFPRTFTCFFPIFRTCFCSVFPGVFFLTFPATCRFVNRTHPIFRSVVELVGWFSVFSYRIFQMALLGVRKGPRCSYPSGLRFLLFSHIFGATSSECRHASSHRRQADSRARRGSGRLCSFAQIPRYHFTRISASERQT